GSGRFGYHGLRSLRYGKTGPRGRRKGIPVYRSTGRKREEYPSAGVTLPGQAVPSSNRLGLALKRLDHGRGVAEFAEVDDFPAAEREDVDRVALDRPAGRLGLRALVAEDDDPVAVGDELARRKLLNGQLLPDRLEELRHLLAAPAGAEEGQPGRPLT